MATQISYKIEGNLEKEPLLLLHELGGSKYSWQWLTPKIKDQFKIILVDLPGAGDSPVLSEEMSLDDISHSLANFLDELKIDRVHVAGSAYGAVNAAYFAANYPEKVIKVILLAIGPHISETVKSYVFNRAAEVEKYGMEHVVEYSLQSSFPPSIHEQHPEIVQEYRKIFLNNDPKNYAISSRAIGSAGTILTERIKAIKAETIAVGGKYDPSFTPEVVAEVAKLLPGKPDPVIIKDAGHFPQIQAPEQVAKLMLSFFKN